MSIIVVSTSNSQKEFTEKGSNFGDLIDEFESSGKFADYQFVYEGKLLQNITKVTKIQSISQGKGGKIEIQKKNNTQPVVDNSNQNKINTPPFPNSSPFPNAQQQNPQFSNQNKLQDPISVQQQQDDVWKTMAQQPSNEPTQLGSNMNNMNQPFSQLQQKPQTQTGIKLDTFGNNSFIKSSGNIPAAGPFISNPSNIGAPKIPQMVPLLPTPNLNSTIPKFNQAPNISPVVQQQQNQLLRKEVQYRSQINDEYKDINDFRIKITDKGNRVELDNEKYDMKAVFLEENANEKIQAEIKKQLTKDAYPQDPKLLVKCLVGEQNQSTKVIFKRNLDGLAIQWATGLVTLFDFDLAI